MLVKDQAVVDADAVLQDAWSAGLPVDPKRIADQLGLRVTYLPLESNVSGMLKVEGDDAEIFVNSADPTVRQRFTIAHEIGHYYERTKRGATDFNFIDYRSNSNYDLHEFYADVFAGALLMPTKALRELEERDVPLPLIAKHFGVSVAAVQQRLKRLDDLP